MAVLLFLPLPTALLAGWVVMWFFRRPLRWVAYFGAGLGVMVLLVAGLALAPHHACQDSGLACADDFGFFTVGNLLSGSVTWLMLLVVTTLAEVAVAAGSRKRPHEQSDRGEDDEPYDRYPSIML